MIANLTTLWSESSRAEDISAGTPLNTAPFFLLMLVSNLLDEKQVHNHKAVLAHEYVFWTPPVSKAALESIFIGT